MKVKIKRFIDNKEFYDEYDIDVNPNSTILELLDMIKDEKDRSLTYRSFCRSNICGTCAIRVNSNTVLACKTKVGENDLVIEPVNRVKVIKDLVVDHSYIEEGLRKSKSYFVDEINEEQENLQTINEFNMFNLQTDCILCMACHFECEALDFDKDFGGPFVFTKIYRFFADSRDKKDKKERIEDAKSLNLYNCINCQKCTMVCPKGISSAMDIKMLQSNDTTAISDFDTGMFF